MCARARARSSTMRQEQLPSASIKQEQPPSDKTRTDPLTPIPPRKPRAIGTVPGRPALSGLVSSDGGPSEIIADHLGGPSEIIEDHLGSSSFSSQELNLLASNKVYRSPDSGEWFHREEYPDGRVMITPVNPNAELRRLSDVHANGTVTSRTADTPNLRAPVGT